MLCMAGLLLADAHADVVDEITVTATRRPVDVDLISSAVSVAEADTPLLTDALRDTVGVYVQQTTPGQGAAIIRGLKGSAILHTVDGIRLNNAIFRSAPTQYLALVPSAAVERIEVVRGSPTSLYGSDAVGGVVQVSTRKPTFETDGSRGRLVGRLDTAELTRELKGDVEFGDEALAFGFGGSALKTGDRRTGGDDRIGPSGFEAYSARAIVYRQSEKRTWFVDFQYAEQPETPRVDELVAGFGQTEPDADEFFFAPNARTFLHGQYEHHFNETDWTIDLAWQRIDDDRQSVSRGSDRRRFEENRSDLFGLSSSLSGARGAASWITGVEFYHDSVDSSRVERDLDGSAETVRSSRFPDGSSLSQAGLYANGTWSWGPSVLFSGGIRLSRVDVELAATALTPASDFDVTDLSGDAGIILNVSEALQLTSNIGFGFRAPNIFDLGTLGNRPGNRFNIPNTSLDSEHVTQVDLGLRYRADRLRVELVVYRLDYDDRITSVTTGQQTPDGRDIVQSVNASSTAIYGVEVGFDLDVSDALSLHGIVNYARGEQQLDGGTEEPSDRMPPLSGQLRLDYSASARLTLSAALRFADEQDRLSARDVGDSRIDPDGTAGWVTADLVADIAVNDSLALELAWENLLDASYRYHGSGLDAAGQNLSLTLTKTWN